MDVCDASPSLLLDDEQVRSFHENGFLTLQAISPEDEVNALRRVLERLVETRAGYREGAQFDILGDDESAPAPRVLQILNPIHYAPELRGTRFRTNARAIARQLLGPAAAPFFEHAMLKPARQGAETPWHQDEAYRLDPNFEYKQISVWMPLQPATVENGCMVYVPGSHRGPLLAHRTAGNDPRSHALECCDRVGLQSAIACPVPAGGCVIHDGRTLHYAGPNRTGQPRWAYVLVFDLPPVLRSERADLGWIDERRSADMERKRRWLRRGGLFVETWRWLRQGPPLDGSRLLFLVRRALHDIVR